MARQCPRCGKPRTDEPHTCYLSVEDAGQIEAAIERIQRPDDEHHTSEAALYTHPNAD